MSDFPVVKNVDNIVISPGTSQSIGEALSGMGLALISSAWPTANKAIFVPFSVFEPITIRKMFVVNAATISGNIDVGIYERNGARIVSSGSTAHAGASAIQEFDITDTTLNPGLYYLAAAMDNNTGTLEMWTPNSAICRSLGVFEQTSAFALPSTATFAAITSSRIPSVCATQRGVV